MSATVPGAALCAVLLLTSLLMSATRLNGALDQRDDYRSRAPATTKSDGLTVYQSSKARRTSSNPAPALSLPLAFESIRQHSTEPAFVARARDMLVTVDRAGASLNSYHEAGARKGTTETNLRKSLLLEFAGASQHISIEGVAEHSGIVSHFEAGGRCRTAPAYSRVRARSVYDGIDVEYYGHEQGFEFDLILKPGADVREIALRYSGSDSMDVDGSGQLVLEFDGVSLIQPAPYAFQDLGAEKREVQCSYVRGADSLIRFELGPYDSQLPLTIDPVLGYSTYLGGSKADEIHGVAVDSEGSVYVVGNTTSSDFYAVNALQSSYSGPSSVEDVFVAKLNAEGTALIYSTYLGGHGSDLGLAIAVDSSGCAYVTGQTSSSDFPTTSGAFQTTAGGGDNVFVVKLGPAGNTLLYSTYFSGSMGNQRCNAIAVDSSGSAYITGRTTSVDFPTTAKAVQRDLKGFEDAFVVKLTPSGDAADYSTLLGGSSNLDEGFGIAVDGAGFAYVAGHTASTDFPVSDGAIQKRFGGGNEFFGDAFVAKLNQAGSALVYSTYLGGGAGDRASAVAVNANGEAFVAGITQSTDFPTANALQGRNAGSCVDTFSNCSDAFVAKLNQAGTALLYSTYIGGGNRGTSPFQAGDSAAGIAVDQADNAYVAGTTSSADFPVSRAVQSRVAGNGDCFVVKLGPGGELLYATYLGGTGDESASGVAAANNDVYVVGVATSVGFPTTPGALQSSFAGSFDSASLARDGFIARITTVPPVITAAEAFGKHLLVSGMGFDDGAVLLVDGAPQKTIKDSDTAPSQLEGKKSVKRIPRGHAATVQVLNGDGGLSSGTTFIRPAQ